MKRRSFLGCMAGLFGMSKRVNPKPVSGLTEHDYEQGMPLGFRPYKWFGPGQFRRCVLTTGQRQLVREAFRKHWVGPGQQAKERGVESK